MTGERPGRGDSDGGAPVPGPGVTMRAWGRGWRVCWLRFIKPRTSNYGETRAAARMGIGTIPLGDGSARLSRDLERDRALARERRERARGKIGSAACDLVVLDETTCPMSCAGSTPPRRRRRCAIARRTSTLSSRAATPPPNSSPAPTS